MNFLSFLCLGIGNNSGKLKNRKWENLHKLIFVLLLRHLTELIFSFNTAGCISEIKNMYRKKTWWSQLIIKQQQFKIHPSRDLLDITSLTYLIIAQASFVEWMVILGGGIMLGIVVKGFILIKECMITQALISYSFPHELLHTSGKSIACLHLLCFHSSSLWLILKCKC